MRERQSCVLKLLKQCFTVIYFNFFCSCRYPSSDLCTASTQEAILCVKSCLCILKTVSPSCEFNLVLECLQSMAIWVVAVLEKVPAPEVHHDLTFKETKNLLKETIDAVKKWLQKTLLGKIPCYNTADANKELQVCMLAVTSQSALLCCF